MQLVSNLIEWTTVYSENLEKKCQRQGTNTEKLKDPQGTNAAIVTSIHLPRCY
jgi:hypothetical protein